MPASALTYAGGGDGSGVVVGVDRGVDVGAGGDVAVGLGADVAMDGRSAVGVVVGSAAGVVANSALVVDASLDTVAESLDGPLHPIDAPNSTRHASTTHTKRACVIDLWSTARPPLNRKEATKRRAVTVSQAAVPKHLFGR
jgi:hypothetical protein